MPTSDRFTRNRLVRYAGASGDFNEIHHSDHHARALGLDGVVAHGMLTMGAAMRHVVAYAGDPARVVTCTFRFSQPVPVPDDDAGAEVAYALTPGDPVDGLTPISIEARCGETLVGRGKATIR